MAWHFITRQQKQEFDSIAAGHEAALISMGIIEKAERKEDKGPECPYIFASLFEKYRELKFIQRDDGDTIKVYPREMLSWADLKAFQEMTGHQLSYTETQIIMNIDAIFEGRNDGR